MFNFECLNCDILLVSNNTEQYSPVSLAELYYQQFMILVVAKEGDRFSFNINIWFEEIDADFLDLVFAMVGGLGTVIMILIVAFVITVLHLKGKLKISTLKEAKCCIICRRKKKMGEIEIDMTEFNEVVEILENGKLTKRDHDEEVKMKTAGIAF